MHTLIYFGLPTFYPGVRWEGKCIPQKKKLDKNTHAKLVSLRKERKQNVWRQREFSRFEIGNPILCLVSPSPT